MNTLNLKPGQLTLADLRARNDAHLAPERTADIRGRIAQLKELLALANEPKPPQP